MKKSLDSHTGIVVYKSLEEAWHRLDDAYKDLFGYVDDNVDHESEDFIKLHKLIDLIGASRRDAMRAIYTIQPYTTENEEL